MTTELSKDPTFRGKILALMYQDPVFLQSIVSVMRPEYFNSAMDEVFAKMFLEYGEKYPGTPLTWEVVKEELAKLVDIKRIPKTELSSYLLRYTDFKKPVLEAEYIKDEVGKFLLERSMSIAVERSMDLLKKGKYDEIVDEVTKARDIATPAAVEETKTSILSDKPEVDAYIKELRDPEAEKTLLGIETGITDLDKVLHWHGINFEEMFVYCGPPGRGKSMILLNNAIWANLQGYHILYYTLEVGENIYKKRYHACITGIPIDNLHKETDRLEKRWERLQDYFPKMGKFILRDMPSRSRKPSTISREVREFRKQGIDIRGIVIDYADIMASDLRYSADDKRLELGNIYEENRGLTKELEIFLYTASQGNRGSLNKEEVDMDSLAEDFSKAFTADYLAGLSQSKKERFLKRLPEVDGTGKIRIFLAKNRNGEKGANIEVWPDFSRARLSSVDWNAFDEKYFFGT